MNIEEIIFSKLPNGKLLLNGKRYLTLKEACYMKNLPYGTAKNNKVIQPNFGIPDFGGPITGKSQQGSRKLFSIETVMEWLEKTNLQLIDEFK